MSFRASRLRSGRTPVIREKPVAAAQAFEEGALLLMDVNGNWAECGANPASIGACAESAYGTDTTGFVRTGKREFPPGFMQGCLVQDNQNFHCEYLGVLPAADGGTYDVIRDADNRWKVNFASSANARAKLVGRMTNSPENRNRVLVVILAANVQVL